MLDFSVTFIITIINITILYFILRAILFKPVTKFMAERAQRIQDSIDQAAKNEAELQETIAEYKEKLKNAESEAKEIVQSANKNAEQLKRQIIEEGKQEAAIIIARGREQIEADRQAALAKFRLEAAALVIAASAKLASRDFSGDDNRRYANMLLEELAAQKGRN